MSWIRPSPYVALVGVAGMKDVSDSTESLEWRHPYTHTPGEMSTQSWTYSCYLKIYIFTGPYTGPVRRRLLVVVVETRLAFKSPASTSQMQGGISWTGHLRIVRNLIHLIVSRI